MEGTNCRQGQLAASLTSAIDVFNLGLELFFTPSLEEPARGVDSLSVANSKAQYLSGMFDVSAFWYRTGSNSPEPLEGTESIETLDKSDVNDEASD